MKNVLSFILLFTLITSLHSQSYDISQYRARFERRPFLELDPSLSYSGLLTNQFNQDQHSGGAALEALWREHSNLDERQTVWTVLGRTSFGRAEFENPDRQDQSNKQISINGTFSQTNYNAKNRFWGFRGNAFVNAIDRDNEFLVSNRFTNINIQPGIFFGGGRTEFAEDALLANWMMDDLLEVGAISSATPEQRFALAQRVTSIIGNRTFDFRRRRIYELQQLKQLFEEENINISDDFLLFAILNDNWAFANRAALPHGKQWVVGVDGGGSYSFASLPVATDNFLVFVEPYVRFESAKIRHNNASTSLFAQLRGFYRDNLDEGNGQTPVFSLLTQSGVSLSLGHSYVWLPMSRTTLRWNNAVNLGFTSFDADNIPNLNNEWTTNWQSVLSWNYFISYTWRLSLDAGIQATFINREFDKSEAIRPFFNLRSTIAIF